MGGSTLVQTITLLEVLSMAEAISRLPTKPVLNTQHLKVNAGTS
jgi:hypothetical protein